jgi:hypothetical protein
MWTHVRFPTRSCETTGAISEYKTANRPSTHLTPTILCSTSLCFCRVDQFSVRTWTRLTYLIRQPDSVHEAPLVFFIVLLHHWNHTHWFLFTNTLMVVALSRSVISAQFAIRESVLTPVSAPHCSSYTVLWPAKRTPSELTTICPSLSSRMACPPTSTVVVSESAGVGAGRR